MNLAYFDLPMPLHEHLAPIQPQPQVWIGMGEDKRVRPVPSRQWSASELKDGHKKLLNVKAEGLPEEALLQQIKDRSVRV